MKIAIVDYNVNLREYFSGNDESTDEIILIPFERGFQALEYDIYDIIFMSIHVKTIVGQNGNQYIAAALTHSKITIFYDPDIRNIDIPYLKNMKGT
jgi:hypothetical protein